MKLEDQVVSLELAKKMKELGFEQESYWCHSLVQYGIGGECVWSIQKNCSSVGIPENSEIERYSAHTVAELDNMLKDVKYESHGFPVYMVWWSFGKWHSLFRNPPLSWSRNGSQEAGEDKQPANARAKMLIYLKENNLI